MQSGKAKLHTHFRNTYQAMLHSIYGYVCVNVFKI